MAEMLNEGVKKQLREVFTALQNPVSIIFFESQERNCEYCDTTKQLLEEVTSLSDRINLEVHDIDKNVELASKFHVDKVPGIMVAGRKDGKPVDYGVRFAGVPAGHEFTSLIRSVMMVSAGNSGLKEETRQFLATLKEPIYLQVYVTPT